MTLAIYAVAASTFEPFVSHHNVYINLMSALHGAIKIYIYEPQTIGVKTWHCLALCEEQYLETNCEILAASYGIVAASGVSKVAAAFISACKLNQPGNNGRLYHFAARESTFRLDQSACEVHELYKILETPLFAIEKLTNKANEHQWLRRLNATYVNWAVNQPHNKRSAYIHGGLSDLDLLRTFYAHSGIQWDEVFLATNRLVLADIFVGFDPAKHKSLILQVDEIIDAQLMSIMMQLMDGALKKLHGIKEAEAIYGWQGFIVFINKNTLTAHAQEALNKHCNFIDAGAPCSESTASWAIRNFANQRAEFGYIEAAEEGPNTVSLISHVFRLRKPTAVTT